MQQNTVLWIYIALLLVGGLMGFIKGKSKISLITSVLFAIPLILCALGKLTPFYIADIVIGFLALFFLMRFAKGKKFMPSGFMMIVSLLCLGGLLALR